MKCALCKKDIPKSRIFIWDALLRKCFKKFNHLSICSDCHLKLDQISRERWWNNTIGFNEDQYYLSNIRHLEEVI